MKQQETIQSPFRNITETDMDIDELFDASIHDFIQNHAGKAAQETLKQGIPIYYSENDTPDDLFIKEYPSGKKELVRWSEQGDTVIREL